MVPRWSVTDLDDARPGTTWMTPVYTSILTILRVRRSTHGTDLSEGGLESGLAASQTAR